MTTFARQLEQDVCHEKCLGFRRMLNTHTKNISIIQNYVMADVAMKYMDQATHYLVTKIHRNNLHACMILETKGLITLPKMVHYMDEKSVEKHCDKALCKFMLERIFPSFNNLN